MKKRITTLFLLAIGAVTYAQEVPGVGIGTPLPTQSAMLDIKSTDKGVLIPRIAIADVTKFQLAGAATEAGNPDVKGLIVFNTTEVKETVGGKDVIKVNVGFHFWNGTKWEPITSQTQLDRVVTETKTEIQTTITEKIKEITEIPGDATDPDLSYMVVYKPGKANPGGGALSAGVLQYLVPSTDPNTGKITYKKEQISFNDLVGQAEALTSVTKTLNGTVVANITAPTDAGLPGKIFYTYKPEKGDVQYIDLTGDFETIIKTNESIRTELVKVIKDVKPVDPTDPKVDPIDPTKPVTSDAYGNVYYGIVNGSDKPVLYSVDKDGKVHYINISQNLINEFINNPEVVEKLKETLQVVIENNKGKDTGETIGGKYVRKMIITGQTVVKGNGTMPYNSEFNDVGFDVAEFGRLLSATITDENGNVVMSSVTAVTYVGDKLNFRFGTGSMFATLPADKKYDIILEYVSTSSTAQPIVKKP